MDKPEKEVPIVKGFDLNKYSKYTPTELLTIYLATTNLRHCLAMPTEKQCVSRAIQGAEAIRNILHQNPLNTEMPTKTSHQSTRSTALCKQRQKSWGLGDES